MSDRDEHLEVLRAMWGEMKTLNARVDTTNERLDQVIVELKEGTAVSRPDRRRLERLERRVDALERRDR